MLHSRQSRLSIVRCSCIIICIRLMLNASVIDEHTSACISTSKTTDACWRNAQSNSVRLQRCPTQKLGCACQEMSVTDMAAWVSIDFSHN